MVVAVLIAVVLAPFDVAYHWVEPHVTYKVFAKLLDVTFMVDMVVHFNTAFFHQGHLKTDRWAIALHYAQGLLVPDLISNLPLDWFVGGDGKSRKVAKLLKLPKMFRFLKLLATLEANMEYISVSTSLACILLLAHYGACFWAFTLARGCDETDSCPPAAAAYLQALRISVSGFMSGDYSSYFVPSEGETALLAAGRSFGEALSLGEDIAVVVMNLAGLPLIGLLFANVASALKVRSQVARQRLHTITCRKEEMNLVHTPKELEMKVLATYDHLWNYGGFKDGILRDPALSLDLRREIAFDMYGEVLRSIHILRGFPARVLKCLAQKVEVQLYTPGDLMILYGQVGQELFIMMQGKARPVNEEKEFIGDVIFGAGSCFGELCFLKPGSRRSASVVCLEFCRVMVLTLEVFQEFVTEEDMRKSFEVNAMQWNLLNE